ncbi:molybdopterin molybdotransferase MoeA [Paludibaculum fermentans]|uniref:Molybdopterin molybdenumtransferase n=1 Tax=Paludibaculum fermentans TaxID=1473598 RepID=A0A7S7NSR3_PALFE|nr:gephyrin-like molybdotransferase Glp [Paludibaculum fermentans]QOY89161.1 molybdopterin molybdotransferase MoeA [Paludibaculum fermentans]
MAAATLGIVEALSFLKARSEVLARVRAARVTPHMEFLPLEQATGRVLAEPAFADRDYPPEPRSMRDGFAVRAADLPGTFTIVGEVRAGQSSDCRVEPGEAVEIMTGASVPEGADTVVMVEHTTVAGDRVDVPKALEMGANVNPQGRDAVAGALILRPGIRLGYAEIALLASIGQAEVAVYKRPRVAILATGDELVEVETKPEPHQIRNSNTWSLAAQVIRAGGEAVVLPVAPDELEITKELIANGLECDVLLLSGGVSAGKYDLVETALHSFGAEMYFDRVLIQPGQPCVFGQAQGTFFFGLPGNPASTMVCFEIFARAALELISGVVEPMLAITGAQLKSPFRQKTGLTRFLPARLDEEGLLTPIGWSGSGDIAALTRANAYLVSDPEKGEYAAGDWIGVMAR